MDLFILKYIFSLWTYNEKKFCLFLLIIIVLIKSTITHNIQLFLIKAFKSFSNKAYLQYKKTSDLCEMHLMHLNLWPVFYFSI